MVWSARPARPMPPALPPPARWLATSAAALAVVAMASPQVFPAEVAMAMRPPAQAAPPPNPAPPTPAPVMPTGDSLAANVRAAAAYAGQRDWMTGIAVVDTTTGQATIAGNAHGFFPAESTVKVLVAARLLTQDTMRGDVEAKARAMISRSDDQAGGELYLAAGGDDLVAWAAKRYGVAGLGAPPKNGSLTWGSSPVSPLGIAQVLAALKRDSVVAEWLLPAMASVTDRAADGTDQIFGLRAVDHTAPVKQGWGGDLPEGDGILAPSIGYVNEGRYAVAIYTVHVPARPLAEAQAMTTDQARILFGRPPLESAQGHDQDSRPT